MFVGDFWRGWLKLVFVASCLASDELADFGAEVDGIDVEDFWQCEGGVSGGFEAGGLGIDEEDVLIFDFAEASAGAGERFVSDADAVAGEQVEEVFGESLFIHFKKIPRG